MRQTALAAISSCLVLGVLAGAAEQQKASDDKAGLKVGTKAPDFKLKDQDGKDRTLGEFTKKGNVALIFYRSASW